MEEKYKDIQKYFIKDVAVYCSQSNIHTRKISVMVKQKLKYAQPPKQKLKSWRKRFVKVNKNVYLSTDKVVFCLMLTHTTPPRLKMKKPMRSYSVMLNWCLVTCIFWYYFLVRFGINEEIYRPEHLSCRKTITKTKQRGWEKVTVLETWPSHSQLSVER